jgi:hypothetical protein
MGEAVTNKTRFERWAKRQGFDTDRLQEVTRNGPRWVYEAPVTESAWKAWEAQRRYHARQSSR